MTLGAWKSIAITLTNPNSVVIYVSKLQVVAAEDSTPGGCSSSASLLLDQSNISTSLVVAVPADSSVTLPLASATASRIQLRPPAPTPTLSPL